MYRRLSEPLPLSEASLLAVRPALNTPVLNVDFLPVGPARAAIVVFAEEYGGIGLAFGVRSNEGGQVAVFRNKEPIEASEAIADVLEPALANAEQMGFLFDEDMVDGVAGSRGRSDAMALWGELMGEMESGLGPALAETTEVDDPPEIELDDLALDEIGEISLELEDAMSPPAATANPSASLSQTTEPLIPLERPVEPASNAVPQPARPRLSRFRQAEPEPAARRASPANSMTSPNVDAEVGSELGRIPLVRVRREGSKRVPFLARLLSSF
jgi:hypothetical protein